MSVVVRFAPSPTGFLHIGGVRTALFNWLYAQRHGGKYLVRVEDTDRQRSTEEAVAAIFDGLDWLGLTSDEEPVFQASRQDKHREAAERLIAEGHAYRCYCSIEELDEMRARARAEGRPIRYDGRWRERDPAEAPDGIDPVVRFKAPQSGQTVIADLVQGEVVIDNGQLDDMILLRADGSPTYMLSVVVDDIDMGITHVIRGDDHLNNAARQSNLFTALGAEVPAFAHIPLIHGADGAKLSKRHGAVSVSAYREMGYLPEAVCNYLLRLGWAHGDDEIISRREAVGWFDLDAVGRSSARFDLDRLNALNAHYLKNSDDARLAALIEPRLEAMGVSLDETLRGRLVAGMDGLKQRARTLNDLAEHARFYVQSRPLDLDAKAQKLLASEETRGLLDRLGRELVKLDAWEEDGLESFCRAFADSQGVGFGKLAQPLRAALTGRTVSPGLFEVMRVLGRGEAMARIEDAALGRTMTLAAAP